MGSQVFYLHLLNSATIKGDDGWYRIHWTVVRRFRNRDLNPPASKTVFGSKERLEMDSEYGVA